MTIIKGNMCVADSILSIIDKMTDMQELIFCEPYQNGREHGWSLSVGPNKRVSFSEYRRSDDIVVYTGRSADFSMQGNVPSDSVYQFAHYFDYNKHYEAAQFIYDFLKEDK